MRGPWGGGRMCAVEHGMSVCGDCADWPDQLLHHESNHPHCRGLQIKKSFFCVVSINLKENITKMKFPKIRRGGILGRRPKRALGGTTKKTKGRRTRTRTRTTKGPPRGGCTRQNHKNCEKLEACDWTPGRGCHLLGKTRPKRKSYRGRGCNQKKKDCKLLAECRWDTQKYRCATRTTPKKPLLLLRRPLSRLLKKKSNAKRRTRN